MLTMGDEVARSQGGNNNAYCQDNEISWMRWDLDEPERSLLEFTRRVFAIRQGNPVLRRSTFLRGRPIPEAGVKELQWIRADGHELTLDDWGDAGLHAFGMLLHGLATDELDHRGRRLTGETLLLLFNGGDRNRHFHLPELAEPGQWVETLDTAREGERAVRTAAVTLQAHSMMLLRHERTA